MLRSTSFISLPHHSRPHRNKSN